MLQFCNQNNLPQKAVLLLDSAPGHPPNLEDDMTNGYFWGLPVRVLEDCNILKAVDNIKMAWEEVTVSCMKGAWHKIWPSNQNYGTNCDTLAMLIKEISKIAEEVDLDNVDPVGITEIL